MMFEGKKIKQTELEASGWEKASGFAVYCLIFKKDNKRILWNKKSEIIEKIYSI